MPDLEYSRAMRSRATPLAFVLLLSGLVGAGGCKDASQVDPSTPLRFWNGFSGPDGATMKRIVEGYNAEHPDARFEMQIIPWNTYYDKVTLGMAFGGAPDVFIMQVSRLPQYADAGALEPIAPRVAASGLGPKDYVKVPYEAGFWKGVQYALPLDCWPLTLYYNKRLFREAGIASPPTNLREFLDDAHRLTKRRADGAMQWGFALAEIHDNLTAIMDQHGASVIDPDGKRGTLDTPESLAAVDQVRSFFTKEGIAPDPQGNNAWDTFKTGKAAMVMQGIYMIADLQAQTGFEFGAAPIPQFGPKRATWGGSHMLCMPAGLPEDRKAKAWAFIKYLTDHSLQWAAAGQCPVRLSALNDPKFRALDGQYQASRQLGYVQYEPQSPVIGQVGGFADASWEAILMNGEPADPVFRTADGRIDAVLGRR